MNTPDISQKMTLHARKSLKEAEQIASHYKSKEISPEHLFFAIFLEEGSLGSLVLKNMGLKRNNFNKITFKERPAKIDRKAKRTLPLSQQLKAVITRSYGIASSFGYPYVGTEHLVYALIESSNPTVQEIIRKTKADRKELDELLQTNLNNDPFPNISKLFDIGEITLTRGNKNQKSPTPYLDKFCLNLNEDSIKRNEIIVERDEEIERLITILGRRNKNNPLLLGDPGVGKTAIVYGLAQKINTHDVPQSMLNKKILSLDMASLVAGTSFRGEFEMRLKEIIKELTTNKNIVLFIDEIHSIIGAGNVSGGLDAANILKPSLSRGDIQCIGATTFSEYKKHIEKDPALERRFQPIKISEPSIEQAKIILEKVKVNYEQFHNITILPEAIDKTVDLSVRYIPDRFLPDKALDIIDETASYILSKEKGSGITDKLRELENKKREILESKNKLVSQEQYEQAGKLRQRENEINKKLRLLRRRGRKNKASTPITISVEDIFGTTSRMSGIPYDKISSDTTGSRVLNLQKNIKANIVGQNNIISQISNVLLRSYSGITNPNRPLGSFLFLGPTGVGKTFAAKMLSDEIFQNPRALIRIDMSEFMERHNVARLTGAPAGYVGYEEGGKLTEKIRHQPYSVVLFDEIEKAHPDVFNILLQILEEGSLTDAEGRLVNFKNTLIILTSNLGTAEFTSAANIGFESNPGKKSVTNKFTQIQETVLENLKKQVKPEILNRLDNICVFNPLGSKEIRKIVKLELNNLAKRLEEKGFTLKYSTRLVELLTQKSIALEQGARFVRKNIQDILENEIAKKIIGKKVQKNKIGIDVKKEKVVID